MVTEVLKEANGYYDPDRVLARVVAIDDILVHSNADLMELAIIDGWQICVSKNDHFKKGQLAIYFEIDSLLPLNNKLFEFLVKRNKDNRRVNGADYHRLKSIKLRGELSQGLLIPMPEKYLLEPLGTNLTKELGVLKYEMGSVVEDPIQDNGPLTLSRWIAHKLLGNLIPVLKPWPEFLQKSDQARIQNKTKSLTNVILANDTMEVTYKLDGESMTVYSVDSRTGIKTGICSRNNELIKELSKDWTFVESLRYWFATLILRNQRWITRRHIVFPSWKRSLGNDAKVVYSKANAIEEKLIKYQSETGRYITLQGEFIGPGLQGNFESVPEHRFYIYAVYEDGSKPLLPKEARAISIELGLRYVPVLHSDWKPTNLTTVKDILKLADGKSAFNNERGYREGLVFKANGSPISWKAISNKYLLKAEAELDKQTD